ncbi:MAG: hypothetical protein ACLUTA_14515 [Blautia wexlerae]
MQIEEVSASVAGAIRVGLSILLTVQHVMAAKTRSERFSLQAFEEGVVKREELFIASKVWNDMHGKGDVLLACAKS